MISEFWYRVIGALVALEQKRTAIAFGMAAAFAFGVIGVIGDYFDVSNVEGATPLWFNVLRTLFLIIGCGYGFTMAMKVVEWSTLHIFTGQAITGAATFVLLFLSAFVRFENPSLFLFVLLGWEILTSVWLAMAILIGMLLGAICRLALKMRTRPHGYRGYGFSD